MSSGSFTDKITISGSQFSAITTNNIVKFNGRIAYVTSATENQLIVIVPRKVLSGPITVTIGGIITSSTDSLIWLLC